MKLTETKLRNIIREELSKLTEIGGGSTYNWKEILDGGMYTFETPNHEYTVEMNPTDYVEDPERRPKSLQVDFHTKSARGMENPHAQITDEGNALKVISTVAEIVKYVWVNSDHHAVKKADFIKFSGAGKAGQGTDTSRSRIYKHIVDQHFPKADIFEKGDAVFVEPNIRKR